VIKMSINENDLIMVKPGEYIRAGRTGQAILKIEKPTQGLIVKKQSEITVTEDMSFLTVLVDGQLVNLWKQKVSVD